MTEVREKLQADLLFINVNLYFIINKSIQYLMFKTLKTLLRAQFLVYHLFGLVLVQKISQHRAGKIQRVAP